MNGKGENGVGGTRAQSGEMAPYEEEHWRVWGRRRTAARPDGKPGDAGVVGPAVPACGWVTGPGLEWGSGSLKSEGEGQSGP